MMKPHFAAQAKERRSKIAEQVEKERRERQALAQRLSDKNLSDKPKPEHDQKTATKAAGVKFDIFVKLAMAFPTHPQLEHIGRNARRYNVHGRTIYRWLRDRVDIENPQAVAAYLLTQKNPSQSALEAVRNILLTETI